VSCGVCGAAAPEPFRRPPAETAPDLDLRPGQPARGTLMHWVRTCRSCRAAAPDVSALAAAQAEIVRGTEYAALRAEPLTLRPFLRWAMLSPDPAAAWRWAAWAADDAAETARAVVYRRRAAAAFRDPGDAGDALLLADVRRRAGDFDAARAACDDADALGPDPDARSLIAFQRARVEAGDAAAYSIASALRPPARNPHVAHGKTAARPWWRLFGSA